MSESQEVAVLETSQGTIEIKFFSDKAPGHVENFQKLAVILLFFCLQTTVFYYTTHIHVIIMMYTCIKHLTLRNYYATTCPTVYESINSS